ncbi:MAG TPA: DUF1080 domain-containing protein [Tepidisphaeraceae bacterium]|nr:DUF1080 domain-containing protein [Tepidisphaeraceae bacterium]
MSHSSRKARAFLAFVAVVGLGFAVRGADDAHKNDVLKPGAEKPAHAIVLFDGADEEAHWTPANWPVKNGAMVSEKQDISTRDKFTDYQLHLEFNEPKLGPEFKSQDRGNSGVYQQGRYEIQVLDSYHNDTYAKGGCAAVYGVKDPLKNMAKPPGEWQTYDITFHAAKFKEGKKVENAHVTLYWNGELVQDNTEIPGPTGGGQPEADAPGPIRLQYHNHSVRFRNLWIVPIGGKTELATKDEAK